MVKMDIIGKSRFKTVSTRTTAAIPAQEAATSEKGIELSEEEAIFDDGNTETASRPVQVPEEKLDETLTSIPPEELGYGDDEPEEDASDTSRASGSSFDEIDDACKTVRNPDATQTEREKAAKVFTDMEGTELYEKMMEGSSETGIRIKGLIKIWPEKPEKEFVVSDNIEDFDIRNYVWQLKKEWAWKSDITPRGKEMQGASLSATDTPTSVETTGHPLKPK